MIDLKFLRENPDLVDRYGDRRNRRRDRQGQKRGIDRFSMFKDRKSTV